MADSEHLAKLKQSVTIWNKWREEHRAVSPDLRHANLHRADLDIARLSGADLSDADLGHANLRDADLRNANLRRADLTSASLRAADLSGAHLTRATLKGTSLVIAALRGAGLKNTNLLGANLRGADLFGANLFEADLSGADLREANLTDAILRRADLWNADLREADLTGADASGAQISAASLAGAQLRDSVFGLTTTANCDLRGVKGLDAVKHDGPSYISIDTIYKSEGQIPESFLLGCGVPNSFIAQIPALVGALQPIQFYSCFISYSTKDEEFARRLHERMRAEKLRVWFAPEDVQGGKKLHEQIERAIQVHDRLLLVLSENSIHSEWVITEIRNALKVEKKDGRRKLFPIRVCDYDTLRHWECFDGDFGKDLANEVRQYFIPDFSNWKQHDDFESAFAKLLRDLRSSEP